MWRYHSGDGEERENHTSHSRQLEKLFQRSFPPKSLAHLHHRHGSFFVSQHLASQFIPPLPGFFPPHASKLLTPLSTEKFTFAQTWCKNRQVGAGTENLVTCLKTDYSLVSPSPGPFVLSLLSPASHQHMTGYDSWSSHTKFGVSQNGSNCNLHSYAHTWKSPKTQATAGCCRTVSVGPLPSLICVYHCTRVRAASPSRELQKGWCLWQGNPGHGWYSEWLCQHSPRWATQ